MDFSNVKTAVLVRVGALVLTIFLLSYLVFNDGFIVTELILFILLGLQTISLIKYVQKDKSDDIMTFLEAIDKANVKTRFSTDTSNEKLNHLYTALNRMIKKFSNERHEKEDDYQYLKNIVQHIGIGLITFDSSGNIQMINTSAKKLLKVNNLNNVNELKSRSENLVDILLRLRTGGRDLLRLETNGEVVQLAIYAIELTLRGEIYKLISLQNIQNELEEKEMEAWQNLVRVLTHEIMNSVTPISSLANTVELELNEQLSNDQQVNAISNEEVADLHLAVHTIKKRSEGLIRFVQDFRNLTHIPTPKLVKIGVKDLLEELLTLLNKEIKAGGVQTVLKIMPEDMSIMADSTMIEQVIINLIKNATQAFDDQTSKIVEINAFLQKGRPVISVKDNGTGIDAEAMEKIFIPFFTTKKDGSGIGLSLSRQIMRKHQGTLSVKSKADEGTEFFLRF